MASAAKGERKPSMLGALVPVLVLTLAAAGGGALVGRQIASGARAAAARSPGDNRAAPAAPERAVREMTPVVTNLAAPEGAWVRLQTAAVFDRADAPAVEALLPKVGEDMLAFVRTLTLDQLQGASGLEALRDDLDERAKLRSDGKVREILIEMLVVR